MSKIVGIQKFLLDNNTAIPYSYGSILCNNGEAKFGIEKLDPKYVEMANEAYKKVSNEYKFLNSNLNSNGNADDVFNDYFDEDEAVAKNEEFVANNINSFDEGLNELEKMGIDIENDLPF